MAPPPWTDYDNVGQSCWRPDYQRMPIYLALVTAALWLTSYLPMATSELAASEQSLVRYAGWFVLLSLGFAYVSKVTSRRQSSGLRGRHYGFRDFCIVQAAGLGVFVLGGRDSVDPTIMQGSFMPARLELIVLFLAGLHISYLEKLPRFMTLSINAKNWRAGGTGARLWMIMRLAALMFIIWRMIPADAWQRLCLIVAVVAPAIVLISIHLRRSGYYFYFHHWFVFMLIALATASSAPLCAFSMAAFVEGAARWSCAPLWHRWPTKPASVPFDARSAGPACDEPEAHQLHAKKAAEC